MPQLRSIEDFFGYKWLNLENRNFFVYVSEKVGLNDLHSKEILKIIESYLKIVEKQIKKGYSSKRGTNEFIGYPIKDYISNYMKRVPNFDSGRYFTMQHVDNYSIKSEHYIYKNSIINKTEKQLVDRVLDLISELKIYYDDVYLIRMDENMHRESKKSDDLKLFQFEKNPEEFNYSGFQPDFILLLSNKEYYIQIFIEPKGEDRYLREKWKEDILSFINKNEENIVINHKINNTKIKGLKFYFSDDEQGTIKQLRNMVIPKLPK